MTATGALILPKGTAAQEPGTPIAGMIRFNSDTNAFEGYNGTSWGSLGAGNSTTTGLWQNSLTITTNQTVSTGYSAVSVGPITIAAGASVTVPIGSRWVIL